MTAQPTALNPAAVRVLSALIEARTGQHISAARSWRIESSLKPVLRQTGLASLDQLVGQLVAGRNEALAATVVNALLNNETSFFRDVNVFDQIDRDALELLRERRAATRKLRIWSAACSTGQEAYSIAMMLRDAPQRWAGWSFDIFASDISCAAVARARKGRFSRFEIQRGLPVRKMLNWFREDGDEWVASPTIARDVRFARHDLRDPAPGVFDLILCRNVLMYFPVALRTKVFDRLADALAPGGMLVLGAGETVIGQTDRFVSDSGMRGLYSAAPVASQSPLRAASR